MKLNLLNAILAISLPCLLCLTVAAQQPPTISPGGMIQFAQPSGGSFGRSDDTLASASIVPSAYTIKASASGPVVKVTSFAFLTNDFMVTGDVARPVGAQISARAEWKGKLTVGGIIGAQATAEIRLTLTDLSENRAVATTTILNASLTSGTLGGDTSDESGDQGVNIQANLIRGHTYRLTFRLDCSASGGAGVATSDFFDSDRRAKLSNLTVQVAADSVELLEMIKTTVNALADEVATIRVIVGNIDNRVNERLDVAVSTRASQVSVNNVQNSVNNVQNSVNSVQNSVNNVQNSVNNVQNTVNVINTKVDDLAGKLMRFQSDALRSAIEAALVEGDRYNVAWYQTPTNSGGHLDLVRQIVQETINNAASAGAPDFSGTSLNLARRELALGDTFRAVNNYKDAYDHYRAAYLHLSIVPGDHRP
jgi:archaellum component FlaC